MSSVLSPRQLLAATALAFVCVTAVPTPVHAQADPASAAALRIANIARSVVRIIGIVFVVVGGFSLWTARGGVAGPLIEMAMGLLVILNPDFWIQLLTF